MGALALTNTGNSTSFGGLGGATGQIIDITGGLLAAANDSVLGVSSNVVRITTNSGTQGFRATGTFATSRTFILNAAANGIDVTNGNTLTLNSPFAISAPADVLTKNDVGTLVLNGASPATWTGGLVINQGAVILTNANSLGSPTAPITISATNASGAALQLGQGGSTIAISNTFNLNSSGGNQLPSGINGGGALEALPNSTVTLNGAISPTLQDAGIGADAGATLNVSGGVTGALHILAFTGDGTINVNSAVGVMYSFQKFGNGTVNLTTAIPSYTGAGAVFNGGTVYLSGAGALLGLAQGLTVNAGVTSDPG